MKKIILITLCLLILACLASIAQATDVVFRTPDKKGGASLYSVIEARRSCEQKDFAAKEITNDELGQVLWAMSGKTGEKNFAIPLAMNKPPYVKLYVLTKKQAYLYDWEKHSLTDVVSDSRLLKRSVTQDFAKTAPIVILFISQELGQWKDYATMAVGAMTQNAYLVARNMGLATRFVASINKNQIEAGLNLSPLATIHGALLLGRQ